MTDLNHAREVIGWQECKSDLSDPDHCETHDGWIMSTRKCDRRPEVADVAEELLAAVERVQALAAELEAVNPTGRLIGEAIRDRLEGN